MKSCAICLAFYFQMDIQCGGISVENFVHVFFREMRAKGEAVAFGRGVHNGIR
jgi:hypothetical protein